MNKIHTVLGDIDANDLGEVLCHEHVVCAHPAMVAGFGERWMPKSEVADRAVRVFKRAKECGVTTVIDGTPLDLGRDIELIKEVSERSGVAIIASTGMYYSEEPFLAGKSPEKFASYFIDECENGIGKTGIRPGILKCATGYRGVTQINQMLLTAMALTQRETQLPLFAHNEHAQKTPFAQLEIFEDIGVEPERLVIGHSSDSRDPDYLEDILRHGCYLGFDRIYPEESENQAAVLAELIRRGWDDKLLVSHDACVFIDFGDNDWERQRDGGDGILTTVHEMLFPALRKNGVTERQIEKLVIDNPRRLLGGK